MGSWAGRIVVIDAFAGPGIYQDGQPGSPIIMLNALLEHTGRDRITAEVIYFFIEQDKRRAAQLEKEVDGLGTLPGDVKVDVVNDSYENAFKSVLDDLEERDAALAPTFAFLDPFGYSDAPMSLSGRFLQFARCEVLIYVPLRTVNRWLRREGQERAMTSLFGTKQWADAIAIEDGQDRIRFLHDLFYRQLKKEGELEYVRSFEIVSAAPNSGYHLFFGTSNAERGLLKMKEVMWRVDPREGKRFKDSTKKSAMVLFEEEPDLAPLEHQLRKKYATKPFTIDEAARFALVDTPFLPKHVKHVLKPLENDGKIKILSERKRRRTYPDGTRLRFAG
jgi:three-Cys-motif partner protein